MSSTPSLELFFFLNHIHMHHIQISPPLFICSVEMTGLTDAIVKDLCAAIRASKTLKSLELRNNSLTDVSVPAIVQVMQDSQNMLEMK